MKSVVFSILASGAAAQMTSGPLAGLDLGPHLFQNAAINPSDPEYATCEQAVSIVQECVSEVGGLGAASTADPTALVACACCDGRSNAAPLYSACSDYLSEEAPENTSQYQAYGTLYSACRLAAKCTGGSGSGSGSGGSGGSSVTGGGSGSGDSGSSMTGGGGGGGGDSDSSVTRDGSRPTATTTSAEDDDTATITTSPAEQTYASACGDMLSIFTECTKQDREFTRLPFKEQAECYCCRGSGTKLTWTDAMDNYASSCADWASTGEPDTFYNVAKTFATFCEHFTDVCSIAAARTSESEATATETSGARQTGGSDGDDGDDSSSESNSDATTSENNQGPVTVTVQPTSTESSDSGNDASSARVGFGAVLAAFAALAIAL
ncbi:hypothetical protein FSARC_111 [Fusarium sarcochroum]|uniref:Uncharacterized protein n=1 Tax=Fusarium sarcochroum TaxID=1208366 RepID=A0A8H4UC08_9HYPO|nr:hypothetical protein FSARC_111 [Fusarium sarcochroum]